MYRAVRILVCTPKIGAFVLEIFTRLTLMGMMIFYVYLVLEMVTQTGCGDREALFNGTDS